MEGIKKRLDAPEVAVAGAGNERAAAEDDRAAAAAATSEGEGLGDVSVSVSEGPNLQDLGEEGATPPSHGGDGVIASLGAPSSSRAKDLKDRDQRVANGELNEVRGESKVDEESGEREMEVFFHDVLGGLSRKQLQKVSKAMKLKATGTDEDMRYVVGRKLEEEAATRIMEMVGAGVEEDNAADEDVQEVNPLAGEDLTELGVNSALDEKISEGATGELSAVGAAEGAAAGKSVEPGRMQAGGTDFCADCAEDGCVAENAGTENVADLSEMDSEWGARQGCELPKCPESEQEGSSGNGWSSGAENGSEEESSESTKSAAE